MFELLCLAETEIFDFHFVHTKGKKKRPVVVFLVFFIPVFSETGT
jgi:hypothetical protein